MTNKVLSLLVAIGALVLLNPEPAHAECKEVTISSIVQGQIHTKVILKCSGGEADGSEGISTSTSGIDACREVLTGLSVTPAEFCQAFPERPVVTPASVSSALRRLNLPASELLVQPPNGRTLVNFATNFYTEREEFTRTVRLLGQRVDLRITPAQFTWHFDDGDSATTTTPGAPYPKLEVTHDYLEKGEVSPSVDTTYTADFRVNGGAWRPVPGSVTIPGEAVVLDVVEARPILVGYN